MDLVSAIVLGIVQGLTEFLPVSSSGHLVIGQKLFGFENHNIFFDVLVHLGTLLAVLLVYRKILKEIILDTFKSINQKKPLPGFRLGLYVILGTIPTAIIGLSFKDHFESLFSDMKAVGAALIFTGAILLIQKFFRREDDLGGSLGSIKISEKLLSQYTWWNVVLIGFAQSLAITPGVSRSGTTIAIALIFGFGGVNAALFSFLLAIPAILGAVVLQLGDLNIQSVSWVPMLAGLVASFVSGYFGLRLILKVVSKQRLEWFSAYVWVVGAILLLL